MLAREMRWLLAALVLGTAGCGPSADGALWSARAIQQELVLSRLSDAQRLAAAHGAEVQLVDAILNQEESRLRGALHICPAERRPMAISPADKLRDSLRIRVADDSARLQKVADLALADWYVRRANATGFPELCYRASTALGVQKPIQATTTGSSAEEATVARSPGDPPVSLGDAQTAIVAYALGWTDAVQAPAPLPHYLAAVYGGSVINVTQTRSNEHVEALVDQLAPGQPRWEPDAIWQALLTE
jgi:hypothetical protein